MVWLHVTGGFASVALVPAAFTLNLNRQPSLLVYCRSAPLPAASAKWTVPFPEDVWPPQSIVSDSVPVQVPPVKFAVLGPEPPQATSAANSSIRFMARSFRAARCGSRTG